MYIFIYIIKILYTDSYRIIFRDINLRKLNKIAGDSDLDPLPLSFSLSLSLPML